MTAGLDDATGPLSDSDVDTDRGLVPGPEDRPRTQRSSPQTTCTASACSRLDHLITRDGDDFKPGGRIIYGRPPSP